MHISAAVQFFFLATVATCAVPVTKSYWTIKDTHRTCIGDTCTWSVVIDQNTGEEQVPCSFSFKKGDQKRHGIYCANLFGQVQQENDGAYLHVYEHRTDHIDHVMGTLLLSEVKDGQIAPDMNWDIFTTSTI